MKRRQFIAGLGGAAAWPMLARAQQPALPVVGFLNAGTATNETRSVTSAFVKGLDDLGYVDGRNVEILYKWAENKYDRLPALAADLVRRRVAVIFANGGNAPALAAKAATSTIPIVFTTAGDPVELGLVTSLNRPGANVTGVTFRTTELLAKRLDLLRKAIPAATSIGYLVNPTLPDVEVEIKQVEVAAGVLGAHLAVVKASTPSEIEAAFTILARQRVDALLVDADAFLCVQRDQLAALAARHAIPAIYALREYVEAGGLMSYGASNSDAWRLAGTYAGRILKGEKPADLPVQQSTKIELVINMKTAKALGLNVPLTVQASADEVIE